MTVSDPGVVVCAARPSDVVPKFSVTLTLTFLVPGPAPSPTPQPAVAAVAASRARAGRTRDGTGCQPATEMEPVSART